MQGGEANIAARAAPVLLRALDAFAFSSALVAFAAATLTATTSHALGFPLQPAVLVLAFCGTGVVYCIDRVRDLARDTNTSPLRSAFVAAHRGEMLAAAAFCACAAFAAGALAGARVVAIAGAVAALGFAHRRLKRLIWLKPFYLSGSWAAVVVGLPAAAASASVPLDLRRIGLAVAIVGACVHANVILSNLRDSEGLAARIGAPGARRIASALCFGGLATALLGPGELRGLAALPLAMSAAVAAFRPGERYGALVVDGALLAGAAAASLLG
jgi:hypothetical protein